ncbi:MAG: xanthine dehydrogenase family protein molybdopterin-binding subunit [Alphaproteobacteria bacterium]|nr:xanthine dehydrogenase family protein molybdopterin-binding subunit [Alphaproteobacteria bacterium]
MKVLATAPSNEAPAIGQAIGRVEDLRLLRGKGRYIDDISLPGQLHAAIFRSSLPHGVIRSLDTEAARKLPGVHAVITAADLGRTVPTIPVRLFPLPEYQPFLQPVIAHDKVRYVGEPIAMVVAESPAVAEDALELIRADIDMLAPVVSLEDSRRDQSLLVETSGSNKGHYFEIGKGDVDAAFATAPYTRRERMYVHRHTGVTMELRGSLAEWDAERGHMTVWGASKVPFANRRILAGMLELQEESVDMIEGDAGGSYGVKGEFFPEDFLVPFAARLLGRPVKWSEDRREHLLAISHARDIEADLEIACGNDGRVLGIRGEIWANIGAYMRTSVVIAPRNSGQFISGPYKVENVGIHVAMQLSNKSPCGTYRGPGRYEADFFRERLFHLAAKDLGIDMVEFRRRNLVPESEMPYPMPGTAPQNNPTALDSGAYELVMDRCLSDAGWNEKLKLQGKLIDGRYHGVAATCFIEGGAAGPRESSRIVIERDGRASVYVGSSGVGQGAETILGQIAADALDVPYDQVQLFLGSTTYVKEGWGSYHSRSTVMGGSAILLTAEEIKRKLRAAAAMRFNCAPEEVEVSRGRLIASDGRSLAFADVSDQGITAEETFANHRHTYAYGTHVAHVAVDPGTGHVAVVDYVTVEDAGRIINPLTLHGQSIGAIVQGLGGTLLEHLVYDENGQMLSASFADYLMPLATDYPNIRSTAIGLRPSPFNPLGAKGAGEGGTIPVGGVIANAVANALSSLGVEPLELPLTPPRVWRMIQAAKRKPREG